MSCTTAATSRSFSSISLTKHGCCPNPKWHFHGIAREVYGYLAERAKQNPDGFVWARTETIAAKTKKWSGAKNPASVSQVERILKIFRSLEVISDRQSQAIDGRKRRGFYVYSHERWSEIMGAHCEFKKWEVYEEQGQCFMGHSKQSDGHCDG
jgi:hypothetical protein